MKDIFCIAIIQDSGKAWDQEELIQLCKKHGLVAVFDARFLCKKNVDKRFFITLSNKWLRLQDVPESERKKKPEKVYYLNREAKTLPTAKKLMERLLLEYDNVGLLVKSGAEVKTWHSYLLKLAERFPATKIETLKI